MVNRSSGFSLTFSFEFLALESSHSLHSGIRQIGLFTLKLVFCVSGIDIASNFKVYYSHSVSGFQSLYIILLSFQKHTMHSNSPDFYHDDSPVSCVKCVDGSGSVHSSWGTLGSRETNTSWARWKRNHGSGVQYTSTEWISTGSSGRSNFAVRAPSILWTTSNPAVTRPNTVCLPSKCGVSAVVMKNCEPLVFGPAFAMASVYFSWRRCGSRISSAKGADQSDAPPVPLPSGSPP